MNQPARAEPAIAPLADPLDEFDIDDKTPLDAGIRRYVLILRSKGIETFESCQGGIGHPFPDPTIRFHGNNYEGYRAFSVAMTHGLPVRQLRMVYDVIDGQPHGPYWELTFKRADRRRDELRAGGR